MRSAAKRVAFGVLAGLVMINMANITAASAANGETMRDVAQYAQGEEFLPGDGSPSYKIIEKNITENYISVECAVTFAEPVTYACGVERMAFPRLDLAPLAEKEAASGDLTFTKFFVRAESEDGGATWRTSDITAFKPGDAPAIVSYSARRAEAD